MNLLSVLLLACSAAQTSQQEAEYYAVDYLVPPDGARVEVGGMGFLPDGRLVVSTRRGQVWRIENPLAQDPRDARFSLFCEGLWEGLGLAIVDGEIVVMQRQELSRLLDEDRDGVCDRIETICDAWGVSDNYHEFGYGLPVDARGNYYLALNVSFFSPKWWHGKSPVPYRGWALKVSKTGKLTPFASGFRSPCGISLSPAGELFITDNQGDWMPASPIFHVEEGGFYGHPASLDWTDEYRATDTHASDTVPPARAASDRKPAALWLPYKWSRSPGNMAWDETGGKFGPFAGQFLLAEMTNGMVLRGQMEKVGGQYQGWCVPLRQRVGSAVRVLFASDGTLLTGLTNRGWGGYAPADGVARVRWTGKTPLEIERVSFQAAPDGGGLRVRFTKDCLGEHRAAKVTVTQYDYDYWWEYGSPERDLVVLEAEDRSDLSSDTRELLYDIPGLTAGRMVRVRFEGLRAHDGTPLLHEEFAYTLNQLPGAPSTDRTIAKLVPPPPARESGSEGWIFLTWGDALGRWNSSGWTLCDAELDVADRKRFQTKEGNGAVLNAGPGPSPFVSKEVFGDCKIHLRFQLPEDGNSGLYVMGRYEVQLRDSSGKEKDLAMGDCGGIYAGNAWPGRAPDFNAFREAGQWHDLDVEFQAPRFDASGQKTEHARFLRVRIDDVLLHENVEVPEPTLGALFAEEAAFGPLMIQGDHSQVAIGDVRVFPKVPKLEPEGWEPLFDGSTLEGWRISDEGNWSVEDGVILGQGKTSHLFSPRDDYEDFEVRGRFKISDGGNSGFYFRTTFGPGWPAGYEAQINSTYTDPQKTGSLYALVPNGTTLVPPDTWFDYRVRCQDEPAGTHISIWVNDVLFVDHVDPERRHARGHIALQQHHEGSVIEAKDLWVREL